jgi:hypothetical protein
MEEEEPFAPALVFGGVSFATLLIPTIALVAFGAIMVEGLGEGKTVTARGILEPFGMIVVDAIAAAIAFAVGMRKYPRVHSATNIPKVAAISAISAFFAFFPLMPIAKLISPYLAAVIPFLVAGYIAPRFANQAEMQPARPDSGAGPAST